MKIEKVNTWEVQIVLCLVFDSHGSVITPLIYSKHEISDCDRRCCQNIKHTLGAGVWGVWGGGHVYSCLFSAVRKWWRGMVQLSINIMNSTQVGQDLVLTRVWTTVSEQDRQRDWKDSSHPKAFIIKVKSKLLKLQISCSWLTLIYSLVWTATLLW